MRVKENPELDYYPLLNDKEHTGFQHIIGVCQWMIVAVGFDLAYAVSKLSSFLDAPRVGHIDLIIRIFCYLKKYPKRRYAINPHPLTIDADYESVQRR